jgi:hypothetical protein
VLTAWLPAGGAILDGFGNFRKWGLAEGSRSLGANSWGVLSLASSCVFLSASYLPGSEADFPSTMMLCPNTWGPDTRD